MNSRARIVSRIATFLIAVACTGVLNAGERVPFEKVPTPVVKGMRDRFPLPEIKFIDKEPNGSYEFGLKQGDRVFEAIMSPNGKLVKVKELIEETKLPTKVKESVAKKYPDAKFLECEKVTIGDGDSAKVVYEMDIRTASSNKKAIALDEDGNFVK